MCSSDLNRGVDMQRKGRHLEALRLAVDRATGFPGPDAQEFLGNCAQNVLAQLIERKDWSGSLEMTEAVRVLAPGNPEIRELYTLAARNFAVDTHNRFAARYNARDTAGARAILEEGLRRLPGDPILTQDLEALR